ncbi:MAG: hypothetical protein OXE84_09995 [Rhodobacteraceae bacterium]|nr:hypothetical protein [Paracoccaceae bacterium]MCY4195413.1 hypothetical protein [Paracoccaceae bacterium]
MALTGFGPVTPKSEEYKSRGYVWQWFELNNSQTILAKRKAQSVSKSTPCQFPFDEIENKISQERQIDNKLVLEESDREGQTSVKSALTRESRHQHVNENLDFPGLDAATQEIISSGFDDTTIGRIFNQCINGTGKIEIAVGLAAIVAKAKIARKNKQMMRSKS